MIFYVQCNIPSYTSSFNLLWVFVIQAFRIPLGAVGYYIVAKFIPMTPDGDSGEPVFVISDKAVESRCTCFLALPFVLDPSIIQI